MLPDSHQLAAFGGELVESGKAWYWRRVLTNKTWLPPDKLAGDLGLEKMCGTASEVGQERAREENRREGGALKTVRSMAEPWNEGDVPFGV